MIASTSVRLVLSATASILLALSASAFRSMQAPSGSDGWLIPETAAAERNPHPLTPAAIDKGRSLYRSKCARCHGADGTGRGPDADPDRPPADLTDSRRAARNPDGVLYYKIWNGRAKPKMPAMKTDLTQTDVWLLVHFVKSLRR